MRAVRLKKRAEFGRVFKLGQTVGDRNLVLFVLFSGHDSLRVGFAVQRGLGTAVKRNRVRRRLRALYQLFEREITPCGDMVIFGKRQVLDAEWSDLVRSMRRLLKKAGCLGLQTERKG